MVQIGESQIDQLNPLYADLASLIGVEATIEVFKQYKGQQISFPVKLESKEFVIQQIYLEYDGNNVKQLAKKYNYSERWIRQILRNYKEQKNGGNQNVR